MNQKYISVSEAARRLAVTPHTIRNNLPRLGGRRVLGRYFVESRLVDAERLPACDCEADHG
jgi:DeoR/GlpR family transcriptional regulator of sugar metabolism